MAKVDEQPVTLHAVNVVLQIDLRLMKAFNGVGIHAIPVAGKAFPAFDREIVLSASDSDKLRKLHKTNPGIVAVAFKQDLDRYRRTCSLTGSALVVNKNSRCAIRFKVAPLESATLATK